jgi:protein-S-isoprenylcysteine O-methyltransferase Ste14
MMTFLGLAQLTLLSIIAVVTGLKLVALSARRVNPFAVGVGKRGLVRLVEVSAPLIVTIWLWVVLRYSLGIDFALFPPFAHTVIVNTAAAHALGLGCLVAALLLKTGAFLSFGDSWRIGVADPGRLVTRGTFALSRNPIFVAFNLFIIGAFLVNGTLILLTLALAQIALLHLQILEEERFLTQRFPEYAAYCERTTRYIGLPRRR